MAVAELVLRAHIEHRRRPGPQPTKQFMPRYRLQLVPCAEVVRDDPRDLGAVPLAHPAEGLQQHYYSVLTRQTVKNPFALASTLDERRAAKKLQVPGCVRHGQPDSAGEVF